MSPRSPQITKHCCKCSRAVRSPICTVRMTRSNSVRTCSCSKSSRPRQFSAVSNPSASFQWRQRRCCHRVWWSPPLLVRQEAVHSRRYRGAQQLWSRSNSLVCLAFRPAKMVKLLVMRTLQIISLERSFIGDTWERKQRERGGDKCASNYLFLWYRKKACMYVI